MDHKQKCEELRKIRVKMANTLGVPNVVRKEPCNFKGDCKGTCPACYMEEKALMDRIYELAQDGRMDMLFGEDIKVLETLSNTDDFFDMGEVEMGNVIFPDDFEEDAGDTDDKEPINDFDRTMYDKYKPVSEIPVPPPIQLPGMIAPPRFPDNDIPELPKSPVTKKDTINNKKGLFGRKKK